MLPVTAATKRRPGTESPKPIDPAVAYQARINAADRLDDVLPLIRPMMVDHHGDDVSMGAAGLAVWMARKPAGATWGSIDSMPDHSRLEIEKDPEPYRGKKLCTRGSVVQIFTDRSAGAPIYSGVLSTGSFGFVRFVAVGSTRDLVEGSPARFCGIVIGIHSYGNRLGGSTSGVEVVGLFDLPENW